MSESIEQLREFTLFPELPAELRCKIWKMAAIEEPRDVQVAVVERKRQPAQYRSTFDGYADPRISIFNALNSVPPILHTNSESRSEGLKVYKTCFTEPTDEVNHNLAAEPRGCIYLNAKIDTLFVKISGLSPFDAFLRYEPIGDYSAPWGPGEAMYSIGWTDNESQDPLSDLVLVFKAQPPLFDANVESVDALKEAFGSAMEDFGRGGWKIRKSWAYDDLTAWESAWKEIMSYS